MTQNQRGAAIVSDAIYLEEQFQSQQGAANIYNYTSLNDQPGAVEFRKSFKGTSFSLDNALVVLRPRLFLGTIENNYRRFFSWHMKA